MAALKLFIFAALCTSAFATVVVTRPCGDVSQNYCDVSEVRITPCDNANKCVIKRNNDVAISFDFTPNFSTSKLKTTVSVLFGIAYLNVAEYGSDEVCTYISCPLEAGISQTFDHNFHVEPTTPTGSYDLKLKLWNEENSVEACCLKLAIRIS